MNMNRARILRVAAILASTLALLGITVASTASAVEIKLLSASALHPAIDALIPDFEKSSGHKVTVGYGTAGAVASDVQKGEPADIVISSVPMIDRLQAQGKVLAGDPVIMAKVGVGAARSIAYPDPAGGGASGIYLAGLLEQLGIAAEMKPKTKLSTLATLYTSVASGEVEIGFNQVSEILAQPTVELVGPLPQAIQNYTQFIAGIVMGSGQLDAARALVTFLYSPEARTVLKAKGFE